MIKSNENKGQIVWLDRAFWLVWLLFPPLLWVTYQSVSNTNLLPQQLPGIDPACLEKLPQVPKFTSTGKLATYMFVLSQIALYACILAYAHLTIHRCAKGQMFVADTLKTLSVIGWAIVLWPVFDVLAGNIWQFILFKTGDMPAYTANYAIDVAPLGVGLLILAMRIAIEHAITMKQDQDLTI